MHRQWLVAFGLLAGISFVSPACAFSFSVLHSFDNGAHFAEGYQPGHGAYFYPPSDALFGTTASGGMARCHAKSRLRNRVRAHNRCAR